MTEQFNPLSLLVDQDASESFDIKSGGGQSLEPLPAGVTLQARLCGYVELGVHEDTNPQGQVRDKEEVRLFFQVWGKQLQKDTEGQPDPPLSDAVHQQVRLGQGPLAEGLQHPEPRWQAEQHGLPPGCPLPG